MKAAVYYRNGGPNVLRYEDVADPVCNDGGVVIRVIAISIEGGDILSRFNGALVREPHIVGLSGRRRDHQGGRERESFLYRPNGSDRRCFWLSRGTSGGPCAKLLADSGRF